MNKQELFAAMRAEVKETAVKALSGAVLRFRVMTGEARDAFNRIIETGDGSASYFEAAIVVATVVDADGNAMFDAQDVAALRGSNAAAMTEIASAAMDANKIGSKAEDAAAKN